MRTQTIHLTLAALLGLSWALPAAATDYAAADYPPRLPGHPLAGGEDHARL